jgi:AcrR family transcriptional regulator
MSHQDTTQQILDAALAELTEFGMRRTTIEDVTRRARVGRMTLYRRFSSKEELFRAVVTREVARVLAYAQETMARQATVEEALAEGLVVGLRATRTHPLLTRLMNTDREAVLPYLTVDAQGALATVTAFLYPLVATRLAEPDAGRVAHMLARVSQSLALTPFDGGDDELRATALMASRALLHCAPEPSGAEAAAAAS